MVDTMKVIIYASRKYDQQLIEHIRHIFYNHWTFNLLDLIVLFDAGSVLLPETPAIVQIISPYHTQSSISMTRIQPPQQSSHFDAFQLFKIFLKRPATQLVFIEKSPETNSISDKILYSVLKNGDGDSLQPNLQLNPEPNLQLNPMYSCFKSLNGHFTILNLNTLEHVSFTSNHTRLDCLHSKTSREPLFKQRL